MLTPRRERRPSPVTPLPLFRHPDNSCRPASPMTASYAAMWISLWILTILQASASTTTASPSPPCRCPSRPPTGRNLTDPAAITYKFQMLDASGEPYGPELESRDPSGASQMPVNAGSMKFTALSTQYSGDTEGHFSESYWGHRAQGKCEIKPIGSQVSITSAVWENGSPAARRTAPRRSSPSPARCDGPTETQAETPRSPPAQAPLGRIQLYVDGQAVGEPIEMLTADQTLPDGTVLRANTTTAGDTATFTFTAAPGRGRPPRARGHP